MTTNEKNDMWIDIHEKQSHRARPANPEELAEGELIEEWIVDTGDKEVVYTLDELEREYNLDERKRVTFTFDGTGNDISFEAEFEWDPRRHIITSIHFDVGERDGGISAELLDNIIAGEIKL